MPKKLPAAATFITIVTLLLLTISNTLSADQQVITDDGREVLLKEDGSWEYRSTDRFADTEEGRRVRLKEDGSWSYSGNVPLKSKAQVRTTDLDLKLQKVVVETHKKKTQKSARIKTQTVFYVQLHSSAQAKTDISIKDSDISLIEVKDNNEKSYPVLSIRSDNPDLPPGTKSTLEIRADKSPSIWDDVKSMEIIFKTGIFGIQKQITLSQRTIDFNKEDVEGFDSE
ncbi:MAG: hypothetical protein IMF15_03215 [Proteobacteria bacterium]|nr:hypothetical protein [Pseudomonadota bacterium]